MADIILISGKMGSGKSTLAEELIAKRPKDVYEYAGVQKFAAKLYELHEILLNRMERYTGKPRVKKDGTLLQLLGTEWGRKTFGDNVWVDILKNEIFAKVDHENKVLVIIDDCRFENEFDAFPDALKVRLRCNVNERKNRAESWRENTSHPSEVGLDRYEVEGRFDLCFDTSLGKNNPTSIAQEIFYQLSQRRLNARR